MQFQLITFLRLVLEELKSVFYFGDAQNFVYKNTRNFFYSFKQLLVSLVAKYQ